MKSSRQLSLSCRICGKTRSGSQLIPADLVRNAISDQIRMEFPDWSAEGYICVSDLNRFRMRYIENLLESEKGELSTLDREVLESLKLHDTLTADVDMEFEKELTFGEKLSDKLADFGGSWTFLIIFGGILLAWIFLNSIALLAKPFDPYPYILLNLVLSCLAAIQAPVIMMSQNR